MHGNEPTATMALADLFNFLSATGKYDGLQTELAQQLTLLFIPVLNPDGAQRFTRHNGISIDLNRDAIARQAPETKAFMEVFKKYKPDWGFNLHDQRNIFSAGNTLNPATISFLSPSYNYERVLNEVRIKAMKLIGALYGLTNQLIPGQTGRYTDEFYPRAIGEFFHSNKVPCILIESGADFNDPLRNTARKLNFLMLIKAFELIARNEVAHLPEKVYYNIPENEKNILDLIIRSCYLNRDKSIKADLGFLTKEVIDHNNGQLESIYQLAEVGDLSFYKGLDELKGGELLPASKLDLEQPANLSVKTENELLMNFENGYKKKLS